MQTMFPDLDLAGLRRLTHALAAVAPDRLSIGLIGTLGAGKTTFVQSLADGLGIDPADVTSPTFTLHCRYAAITRSITLNHLDAYRIDDLDAWDELGIDELHELDGQWTVIEWADRVRSSMPDETVWVNIGLSGDQHRVVRVDGPEPIVASWRSAFERTDDSVARR